MKKFEYSLLQPIIHNRDRVRYYWEFNGKKIKGSENKALLQMLNQFGEEGWELTTKTADRSDEAQGYILKREKLEKLETDKL